MYGYRIMKADNCFYYELYPNNNNNQFIGRSCEYANPEECYNALKEFAKDVRDGRYISFAQGRVIRIEREKEYRVEFIKDGKVVYYSRWYRGKSAKANCGKFLESIYKHIEDYSKNEL